MSRGFLHGNQLIIGDNVDYIAICLKSAMMNTLNIPTFLYWMPFVQVSVLVIGTIVCVSTAYAYNHVSLYLPFISETGAYPPEIGIFSLSLIIGSLIGIIFILYRYALIDLSTAEDILLKRLNTISCLLGLLAMFGLAGVAAFPMTTVYWSHLLMAGIYFFCMMLYMITVTFFSFKEHKKTLLLKIRVTLCIFVMVFMLLLIICFPIAHNTWHNLNSIIPALKVPSDKGFTLIFISSCLEWGIMLVIFLFTLTLLIELKKYRTFLQLSFSSDEWRADFVSPENSPPQLERTDE